MLMQKIFSRLHFRNLVSKARDLFLGSPYDSVQYRTNAMECVKVNYFKKNNCKSILVEVPSARLQWTRNVRSHRSK